MQTKINSRYSFQSRCAVNGIAIMGLTIDTTTPLSEEVFRATARNHVDNNNSRWLCCLPYLEHIRNLEL